jgi:ribokinase
MISKKPVITVVGSFMMDLVIKAERRPLKGETLVGDSFGMFVGGKGFNQALAAARLGASVHMVGCLGEDDFGQRFLNAMHEEGIDTTFVRLDPRASTGVGSPVIDAHGDNSIIVVPGANNLLTAADVTRAADLIRSSDLVMMQLETSPETVQRAAEIAHAAGVPTLLNPAPARPLPDSLLQMITILTPNETEAQLLTGKGVADDASACEAAGLLRQRGVQRVVLTLGARGALLDDGTQCLRLPGFAVQVVDTTAAGDAFCAALAFQYSQLPLQEAVRFANAVGALATTVLGAGPSMPTMQKVQAFINHSG